jgi:hypothetical protein
MYATNVCPRRDMHTNHTARALNWRREGALLLYVAGDLLQPAPSAGVSRPDVCKFLRHVEAEVESAGVDDRRWGFEEAEDWEYHETCTR